MIRKIVKEELRKALIEISEPITNSPDEIIYNFDAGRAFGTNKIAKDINGLGEYYLSSYFPNSETKESWMYEIQTDYGSSQLIEIVHELNGHYDSYWSLKVSELPRNSDVPTVTNETPEIKGYDNFVRTVNSTMERDINPNLL